MKMSMDPRVMQARAEMSAAYDDFISDQKRSLNKREDFKRKKEILYDTYKIVDEEEIAKKVKEIEKAHKNQRHSLSWKLINELSDKKSSQSTTIQGKSAEDRVDAWYNHFKNLLGCPPVSTEKDEEIKQVFPKLDIKDSPFTKEEYLKAKASIKCGKSCGEDLCPYQ
jgi:hypothetical protein